MRMNRKYINIKIIKLIDFSFNAEFNSFYSNRNPYSLYPIIFIMIFKFKSSVHTYLYIFRYYSLLFISNSYFIFNYTNFYYKIQLTREKQREI